MVSGPCPECNGARLNARSAAVRVVAEVAAPSPSLTLSAGVSDPGYSFPKFMSLDVTTAYAVAQQLTASLADNDALREVARSRGTGGA